MNKNPNENEFTAEDGEIRFDPEKEREKHTEAEVKKVKKLAQTMLSKIKERIHELDHWRDKEETRSIISVMIRDLLWAQLPECYDDNAISDYRERIYEYVYSTYPAA